MLVSKYAVAAWMSVATAVGVSSPQARAGTSCTLRSAGGSCDFVVGNGSGSVGYDSHIYQLPPGDGDLLRVFPAPRPGQQPVRRLHDRRHFVRQRELPVLDSDG